jgi:regulatory protein
MAEAHPASRLSGSAESDAVAAAQQWLIDRGLTVPSSAAARATGPPFRQRPRLRRAESAALGPSAPQPSDTQSAAPESAAPESAARESGSLDRNDQVAEARAVVLRKLSAQARTRHELGQALRAKDVPPEIADQVLDRMEDVGLVDDAAFAQDWVDSRQQRRGLSRRALNRELKHRGVSQDQIDDALSGVGSAQEYSAALELARRRHRSMGELPRDVARRRLAGALARRGFGSSIITSALAEVVDGRSPEAR